MTSRMASCDVYRCASLFYFRCFQTPNLYFLPRTMVCNKLDLIRVVLWTRLRMSFNAYVDPLFEIPSDLPGVNPATNDRMILYCCLMTKVDVLLGDSTVFSWASCHTVRANVAPPRRASFLVTTSGTPVPHTMQIRQLAAHAGSRL
jgi:hypothetical protein